MPWATYGSNRSNAQCSLIIFSNIYAPWTGTKPETTSFTATLQTQSGKVCWPACLLCARLSFVTDSLHPTYAHLLLHAIAHDNEGLAVGKLPGALRSHKQGGTQLGHKPAICKDTQGWMLKHWMGDIGPLGASHATKARVAQVRWTTQGCAEILHATIKNAKVRDMGPLRP